MTVAARLTAIQERMAAACARAGRAESDVSLLAVSKGQPASAIREAFAAGQTSFGENYAQELVAKARELADLPIVWHFIGGLQRNKVKDVLPVAHTIQTVDRIPLVDALSQRASRPLDVLLEVNVSGESQKSGVAPDALVALAERCRATDHLRVVGLMTVPEASDDPEAVRPAFAALRQLRDELAARDLCGAALSMGMSHDFEIAIAEGATLVRVGTAIFGPRGAR